MSMRVLERATGLGTGEISQIETGRRLDPAFSIVLRLARGIGISMEDLALRFEGRSAVGRSSAASPAKAATAIARARTQHEKLGEALRAASEALQGSGHKEH